MDEHKPVYRRLTFALILALTLLRLAYLGWFCPLDLAPDEAHYWDWSRHLDWSYYSKGPLVALLIRGSLSLFGGVSSALTGSEMLAVRLPAVICGALILVALYTLTVELLATSKRQNAALAGKLGLAVVALALTFPVLAAGSLLMTIDAPFVCAWSWALVFGFRAVFRERALAWLWAGLCVAAGVLAKPTMVVFPPMFGLFLLTSPRFRPLLARRGFWFMVFVGALGGVPILVWNAQHDWVTLKHTEAHAGLESNRGLHPLGPLVYLGTQFALLLGYWFVVWIAALWTYRPNRDSSSPFAYLWWMSAPIFVFFWIFSLSNGGGEPNWPIAGYLAGMILAAFWLADRLGDTRPRVRRCTLAFIGFFGLLGLCATLIVHESQFAHPLLARFLPEDESGLPMRRLDPTCRLRGWHELGSELTRLQSELEKQGIAPVLAGTTWTLPGEMGFYMDGHPSCYSLGSALGERHSQYDIWHPNPVEDPGAFVGKTFIIVGDFSAPLAAAFAELKETSSVIHEVDGHPLARWTILVGKDFRGFPTHGKGGY